MTVLFWLRKNQRNSKNEAVINCRITVNGKRANDFTTNIFIKEEFWDSKKQRIKDDVKQSTLQAIRQKLSAIHLDLEMKDIPVTAEIIKNIYLKKSTFITETRQSIKQLAKEFFDNERSFGRLSEKQIRSNEVRLSPFYQYILEEYKKELTISDLTPEFADDLTQWLLYKRKYLPSYAIKIIRMAKSVFNFGMKKRYITHNPFVFVKIKSNQKPLITLSKEELQKLMNHHFASVRLQQVADLFLMQCFTGMAYVDLMNFDKKTHLQGPFICINRQKSETQSLIPLLPQTKELLEKYDYLLPRITNQKYNAYIKEIAEIVGIEKPLTTHVGRKTCGNILLNEGVSIEVVSRILGHRDTKITQHIYAKVNELRITREMQGINLKIVDPLLN